jgi:hypothetical protein
MGLDMYLNAKRYMWYNEDELKDVVGAAFPELPEGAKIKTVTAEVGYWRKANAIHKWFVEKVQEGTDDCGNYYVSREHLEELRNQCQKVIDDPNLAEKTLPTQSGFFFGNTDYNEYYIQDLQETVDICNRALALPENWDLEYHSPW